ncbi:hypothetical protein NKH93_26795 [Mesorhizobium sp. M0954]|uniref:hypothetical protein n=1 Tax=Mesorhizobium sp. M0954 TaxID=2957032 RepID=UPI00333A6517
MTQSGHHFRGAPETGINIACSTSKRKQQRWQDFSAPANRRPFLTATHPSLDMPTAYQIANVVRMKRLSRDGPSIGRKIGFTNHRMWERYAVKAPISGYMYESTVQQNC